MSHASNKSEWDQAILDAKTLIGDETADLSLKTILSNELSNNSPYFQRLVTSDHPFMKTIRRLASEKHHTRGLAVLLLSQALCGEVSTRHRLLAEIAELVAAAQLTHEEVEACGGKLGVLAGDFLLATACRTLSSLQCNQVVRLISVAISEQNHTEFLGDPETGLVTLDEWERLTFLRCGSLLANSCRSVVELADGQSLEADPDLAYTLGRDFAYAWQLHREIQPFLHSKEEEEEIPEFDLNSLPVLIHLQAHPEDYESPELPDLSKIYKAACSGDVLEKCQALLQVYVKKAQESVAKLPPSSATDALSKLLKAMEE